MARIIDLPGEENSPQGLIAKMGDMMKTAEEAQRRRIEDLPGHLEVATCKGHKLLIRINYNEPLVDIEKRIDRVLEVRKILDQKTK